MKPVRLTMQAFGSYGRKTEIDFTVPEQRIFLITGDTGSGKTTIFDAIVFALYGEASSVSNRKDGTELQSQYVSPDTEPYVELCFTERKGGEEEEYTVRRAPRHLRPAKRRGAGYQAVSETVSLIMPDGSEYPSRETDAKLVELVGLTKSQFMQVAMIAQGEFMELLRADSGRKKEIFRRLFGTGLYQDIVDELFSRRKDKQSEIGRIKTICRTEAGHIAVPEWFDKSEELTGLRNAALSQDGPGIVDIERITETLGVLCEELEHKIRSEEERTAALEHLRDRKRDEVTKAGLLFDSFIRLEEAEKRIRACKEEEENVKKWSEMILLINAACDIREKYMSFSDAAKAAANTETEMSEKRRAIPALKKRLERLEDEERSAAHEAEEKLKEYTRIKEKADRSAELWKKIKSAEEELGKKRHIFLRAAENGRNAENMCRKFEEQEKLFRKRESELADTDRRLGDIKDLLREAQTAADRYKDTVRAYGEYEACRSEAERAASDYECARNNYSEKKSEYEMKNEQFLDAQAGFLAAALEPGRPCPVCGSTEHPNPCRIKAEHAGVTREIIEKLSAETSELEQLRAERSRAAGAANELVKEKERKLVEARLQLSTDWSRLSEKLETGRYPFFDPAGKIPEKSEEERMSEAITDILEGLEHEYGILQRDSDELAELRRILARSPEERDRLRGDAEKAAREAEAAGADAAAAEAELRGLSSRTEYASETEANEALSCAMAAKSVSDAGLKEARDSLSAAKTEKDNTEILLKRCIERLPEQIRLRDSRKAEYEALMEEKMLPEERWKELAQKYTRESAAKAQEYINGYHRKKAAAESAFETAGRAVGNSARPDMDKLTAEEADARAACDAAHDVLEELKSTYKTDRHVLKELKAQTEERSRIIKEYACIDSLYERLAGKRTGARMDIETYVQRYYLQRILHAANKRFSEMSAGQFELRMTGAEQAGEGRNRGLDLMVYSAVTGKEREIRTLSGGESFMAALSMALGMADQIGENSSSINLEMMFIDEGFGSLDDNSRNQAVRVLQRMAEGSRLVGIISHVSELKQAIDDQLVVTKDESGSHAAWQIR